MVNNGELPEYQLRHILTISYKVHAEATQFVPGLTKQEAYNQVLDNAKALFDGQRNWVDTAPKHSYVANGSLTRCGKIIYPGTELGKVDDSLKQPRKHRIVALARIQVITQSLQSDQLGRYGSKKRSFNTHVLILALQVSTYLIPSRTVS